MVVLNITQFFNLIFFTIDINQYNQNNGREPRMWVFCLINEKFGMMLINSGTLGVWKTRIANSEQRIVSNSVNSGEQWQIVANSHEQSSIVTALDLISSVD